MKKSSFVKKRVGIWVVYRPHTTSLISSEKSNYFLSDCFFFRFAIVNYDHYIPTHRLLPTENNNDNRKKRTTSLKSRKLVKRGKPNRLSVCLSVGICEWWWAKESKRKTQTEPNKLAMIYHSISAPASNRLAVRAREKQTRKKSTGKKNFRNRRKLFIDGSQLYNVV